MWGHHEGGVDGAETPVQDANDDFHGGGYERDVVLYSEEGEVVGHVSEEAEYEACCADGYAEYGEELEVPTERAVLRVGVSAVLYD